MPAIRIPPSWSLPESEAAPEEAYFDRRRFLVAAAGTLLLPSIVAAKEEGPLAGVAKYPTRVRRNERYKLDRPITKDTVATAYNNFYEFTTDKSGVWPLAKKLTVDPWSIEITGHAKRKGRVANDASPL